MRYCSSQQKDWATHKESCAPHAKSKAPLNAAQKECQGRMIEAQRCQRAGDRAGEGRALGKVGIAFSSLGQHNKAIEFHTYQASEHFP